MSKKKVFAVERQLGILNYLEEKKVASVAELANFFDVTETTIRRDLLILDKDEKIIRTHGGALKIEQNFSYIYTTLNERMQLEIDSKKRIAQYVADNLISDCESIMIDAGSTTYYCAEALAKKFNNLIVVTNTEKIGLVLANNGKNRVIITGGEFIPYTQVQVGNFAEKVLNSFKIDTAIISATGIIPDEGIFTSNPLESQIKYLMIKNSRHTILVADSSKLWNRAFCFISDFSNISTIVTDKNAKPEDIKRIRNSGVKVITV